MKRRTVVILLVSLCELAGCFYPPTIVAPSRAKREIALDLPYDMAWDATIKVIKNNNYKLQVQDPVHGILEVQGKSFTLKDADCGLLSTMGGKQPNEPGPAASSVFNFYVKPVGNESSTVSVEATFGAQVQVPLHPFADVQCISRGAQEKRLLKEIEETAATEHRPTYKPASD